MSALVRFLEIQRSRRNFIGRLSARAAALAALLTMEPQSINSQGGCTLCYESTCGYDCGEDCYWCWPASGWQCCECYEAGCLIDNDEACQGDSPPFCDPCALWSCAYC
jgi:hypothetical protein